MKPEIFTEGNEGNEELKSYAEAKGRAAFDWKNFIERANAGEVRRQEWDTAAFLAAGWVTCACGNQCAKIPRYIANGAPEDETLWTEGTKFYQATVDQDLSSMARHLAAIEKRAAEVLVELTKETKGTKTD